MGVVPFKFLPCFASFVSFMLACPGTSFHSIDRVKGLPDAQESRVLFGYRAKLLSDAQKSSDFFGHTVKSLIDTTAVRVFLALQRQEPSQFCRVQDFLGAAESRVSFGLPRQGCSRRCRVKHFFGAEDARVFFVLQRPGASVSYGGLGLLSAAVFRVLLALQG